LEIFIDQTLNGGYLIRDFENNIPAIVALEPCYGKDGGNTTRIYTRQGEIIEDNCRLQTMLGRTVKHYGLDPVELRRIYGSYLGCNQSVPLPLATYLVLVPLKMRCPEVDRDCATGYVNVCAVNSITEAAPAATKNLPKCSLEFEGGSSLPSFFSVKMTEKRLLNGLMTRELFCSMQSDQSRSGQMMVMEKARPDALDTIVSVNKLLYEMMVEKQDTKQGYSGNKSFKINRYK
jgi:hypothetical protein